MLAEIRCATWQPPIAGRTGLAWLLDACTAAKSISRIVVSTSDDELARYARGRGVEVTAEPVAETPRLRLDAAHPLTTAEDLDGAIKLFGPEVGRVVGVVVADAPSWREVGGAAIPDERPALIETGAFELLGKGTATRVFGVPRSRAFHLRDEANRRACEVELRARTATARRARLPAHVAALVFDFDGVFTDNLVHVSQDGTEAVSCNRSDAFGLAAVRELGIPMIVLSTEANPVVRARCDKLKLPSVQGLADKRAQLELWLAEQQHDPANVIYVGNDINDLGCLQHVGCAVVPADAHESVLSTAAIVLEAKGGHGAVREICNLVAAHMRR